MKYLLKFTLAANAANFVNILFINCFIPNFPSNSTYSRFNVQMHMILTVSICYKYRMMDTMLLEEEPRLNYDQ